jgi:hypothetical protein
LLTPAIVVVSAMPTLRQIECSASGAQFWS